MCLNLCVYEISLIHLKTFSCSPSKTSQRLPKHFCQISVMHLCVFSSVWLKREKSVMGLLLLYGIRCALFVCFLSDREAASRQNMGSMSGSVRISGSSQPQSICVHDQFSIWLFICIVCVYIDFSNVESGRLCSTPWPVCFPLRDFL